MGFFGELKRRSVFRVGTFYIVSAWVLLQAAELVFGILEVPGQGLKWLLALLVLGAPIALFLAWAYEWTPDGLKPDSGPGSRVPPSTSSGRRLDFAIIALLVVAVTYFAVDKFLLQENQQAVVPESISEFDQSVAALPFVNHGSDSDSMAFASGIHEDLLTQMTKIAGLRVISSTTMRNYADTTRNIQQIAEELSVKHILEGGVQKSGNRIRINVQLIDATTDSHLWAQTFDRELTVENVFDIQTEIASEIAKTLRVTLSRETSIALSQLPTTDLEAYKDYIAALALENQTSDFTTSRNEVLQIVDLLRSAVSRDPKFALAWAKLAIRLGWVESPLSETWRIDVGDEGVSASEALARAEEIDANLPQVHLARASFARRESRFDDALSELDLAERGMPNNADVLRSRYWLLRRMGRNQEAFANIKQALSLDPRNSSVIHSYGDALLQMRRWEDAREHYRTAIKNFPNQWDFRDSLAWIDADQYGDIRSGLQVWLAPDAPRDYPAYDLLTAWFFWILGDLESALVHAKLATQGFDSLPLDYIPANELKAWIFRNAGMESEASEAAELAQQEIARKRREQPDQPLPVLALARISTFLEDREAALELLDESFRLMKSNSAYLDKFNELRFREHYSHALCMANELSATEEVWRAILSEENSYTLASLVRWWPPCTNLMLGTENYTRLQEEFDHLSQGQPAAEL